MNRSKPLALLIALGLLGGCVHHHHHYYDDDTVVRIDDLPPVVRDHFYRDHPGVDVREIHVEHVNDEVHYHFNYNDHGEDHETRYGHEGDEIR